MLQCGAFPSRLAHVGQPCFKAKIPRTREKQMFVMRTKCYFPPFCISQETFPRVPRGLVITTTKNCGILTASKGHLRAPYIWSVWMCLWTSGRSIITWGFYNAVCPTCGWFFRTKGAFCSSSIKYLWTQFSVSTTNSCSVVREVSLSLFQLRRPPWFDHSFHDIFQACDWLRMLKLAIM